MRIDQLFLSALAVVLLAFFTCTTEEPVGTIDNPLVLDTYDAASYSITYDGVVGSEKLYIKVINTHPNRLLSVTLTNLTGDCDLYTHTDPFVTPEDNSTNLGTTDESAVGTTTATGELYIMVDGAVSAGTKTFQLWAGT